MQTTPEEKLPDVAIRILTDIYLEAAGDYECGKSERCAAVMAALDDAVHGVTGRARDGIIRDIASTESDVVYESVDSLPEKYRAGAEIFIYSHYELFMEGCGNVRTLV